MINLRSTTLAVFIAGGLLSGTLGLNTLAGLTEQSPPPAAASAPAQPVAQVVLPTPSAPSTGLVASLRSIIAPQPTQQPPDPNGPEWLYVSEGNLWETDGHAPLQLTQDASIGQPALGPNGLVYVERSRNASDIWLASPDRPPRALTRDASPIVEQNHWASEPVFLPDRDRLFVVGDFLRSSTGPGDLAIWEINFGQELPVQITHPPAYGGGDQDVTVDPNNPRQIVFTRYAYTGTQLAEQLAWLDVSSDALVQLTSADRPSRQASYSPDAKQIAFVQHGGAGEENLYVGDLVVAGGSAELDNTRQIVTGTIANPAWSPDGSALAYLAMTSNGFQLWSVALQHDANGLVVAGEPRQITHGPGLDATSRPVVLSREQADDVRQWLASAGT